MNFYGSLAIVSISASSGDSWGSILKDESAMPMSLCQ